MKIMKVIHCTSFVCKFRHLFCWASIFSAKLCSFQWTKVDIWKFWNSLCNSFQGKKMYCIEHHLKTKDNEFLYIFFLQQLRGRGEKGLETFSTYLLVPSSILLVTNLLCVCFWNSGTLGIGVCFQVHVLSMTIEGFQFDGHSVSDFVVIFIPPP